MKVFFGALAFVLSCLSLNSHAQLTRDRPFFQASRALAMGDAYTAINEDFEAVYYNPAGLAKINELQFKMMDLETLGSEDLAFLFKDTFKDITQLDSLLTKIQSNKGKNYSAGMNFLPQLLVKNFSFGLLGRGLAEGRIQQDSSMALFSYVELGGYIHTAFSLFGGILKVGGGVKILDRAEMIKEYTPAEYASSLSFPNEWREGFGTGYDAGLMLTIPTRFLPTLGVAVQDIGSTKFEASQNLFKNSLSTEGPPNPIGEKINVGIAFKMKHGRNVYSNISGEIKNINNLNNETGDRSSSDHIHAGWELNVRKILFLRAGINQGRYWTGGFGLHIGSLALEFSSYGENIAFQNRPRVNDRKYVGRYAIVF